jgi:NCAIR mutase (PurE)-related protein
LQKIKEILEDYKSGHITADHVLKELKKLPFEDIGFARIDHHRSLRRGIPEVIYCEGKTVPQIMEITRHMLKSGANVMGTRADRRTFHEIQKISPDAKYFDEAKIFVIQRESVEKNKGTIAVVCAGTSDIPVSEEAAVTAGVLGNNVERLYDVGVAGIHRLFMNIGTLEKAQVIIVAAGMEGALASVVAGLVDKPVIAVPTSVGYGASFHGFSALLTMLNSCAGGVAVVNIDNGFGAGLIAHQINKLGGTDSNSQEK